MPRPMTFVSALLTVAALLASAHPAGAQAYRLVPGTDLEKYYPSMPGWVRGKPTSETDPSESVSRTTVDFDRKTETIASS